MQKTPLVTIIVATFNEEKDIRRTMDALISLTYQNKEILIIDDASTDHTPQIIEQEYMGKYSFVKLMKQPINRGVGAARNVGIRAAKGEILIILNADVSLPSNFIESILCHYRSGAAYVLVANRVSNFDYVFPRYIEAQYHYLYDNASWINWTEGFSCKREAGLAVGGFPEIPGATGEDAVFGENLEKAGFRKIIDPGIVVTHVAPATLREYWTQRIGRGKGGPRVDFYVNGKSLFKIEIGLVKWMFVFIFETILPVRRLFHSLQLVKYSPKGKKDFAPFFFVNFLEELAVLIGAWRGYLEIAKGEKDERLS